MLAVFLGNQKGEQYTAPAALVFVNDSYYLAYELVLVDRVRTEHSAIQALCPIIRKQEELACRYRQLTEVSARERGILVFFNAGSRLKGFLEGFAIDEDSIVLEFYALAA